MRIALVSEHASPLAPLGGVDAGGQNVHVRSLGLALGRLGAHVTVHTRRDAPDLPPYAKLGPSVWVHHVDAGPPEPIPKDDLWGYMPDFAEQLHAAWSRTHPDVVHGHFWMSGWAALQAATPLGIPVLQTFHALGSVKRRQQGAKDTSPAERCAIEAEIAATVDITLAESNEEVFELVRSGADPRRVWVVPSGVDLDVFSPRGPVAARPDRGARVVVVSRLVERKGVGNVITALRDVPDTQLVIAGGPPQHRLEAHPEARRLMHIARASGVDDRVELVGQIDHDAVAALYRSADVVVCVPWYEPFGLVALEAMACGVPVLASAVGGLVDTVVDGVTGVMVPPRDPGRLANVLQHLLADAAFRRALGVAGARRARRRYGWTTIARETSRAYQHAASRRLNVSAAKVG